MKLFWFNKPKYHKTFEQHIWDNSSDRIMIDVYKAKGVIKLYVWPEVKKDEEVDVVEFVINGNQMIIRK